MEAASLTPDQLRGQLHRMWGGVADGWAEHAAFVDSRGRAVTERLVELAKLRPGGRVLELAGGPGGAGLAAAERVGPDGEVVISDIAPEMTAIASRRAEELGLRNVHTRALDLERIDEPDDSYDAVLCREGLMLVPDPSRAAAEIARVLRPGGRVALSVWGPRDQNPWLGVLFAAVSGQLGAPIPPPGIPGPFSLDDPDRLAGLLADVGLSDVEVHDMPMPYTAGSVEEWLTRTSTLAGPLAQKLAALQEPALRALSDRVRIAVDAYMTPEGLVIPGLALVAAAVHP